MELSTAILDDSSCVKLKKGKVMAHIFKVGAALATAAAVMVEPSYVNAEAQTITEERYRELLKDVQEFKPNDTQNLVWLREVCSVLKEKEDQDSKNALAEKRSYIPPPILPCYSEYADDTGN